MASGFLLGCGRTHWCIVAHPKGGAARAACSGTAQWVTECPVRGRVSFWKWHTCTHRDMHRDTHWESNSGHWGTLMVRPFSQQDRMVPCASGRKVPSCTPGLVSFSLCKLLCLCGVSVWGGGGRLCHVFRAWLSWGRDWRLGHSRYQEASDHGGRLP